MNNYKAYINKITCLEENLNEGFNFININTNLNKNSIVFIKPNFTYPFYQPGITTNPELIELVIKLLSKKVNNIMSGLWIPSPSG